MTHLTLQIEHIKGDGISEKIEEIVRALPGVIEVSGSVTEQDAEPVWRVDDNLTGMRATRNFTGRDIAEHMCGQLNTINSGGRYVVMINRFDGEGWARDEYEQAGDAS